MVLYPLVSLATTVLIGTVSVLSSTMWALYPASNPPQRRPSYEHQGYLPAPVLHYPSLPPYGITPAPSLGLYVRGGLGAARIKKPLQVTSQLPLEVAATTSGTPLTAESMQHLFWVGDVAVGYFFSEHWRADLSYNRHGSVYYQYLNQDALVAQGKFHNAAWLANLYYDFTPTYAYAPYIGIGVGSIISSHEQDSLLPALPTGTSVSTTQPNLWWDPSALSRTRLALSTSLGFMVPFNDHLFLDLSARYYYVQRGDALVATVTGQTLLTDTPQVPSLKEFSLLAQLVYAF